MNIRLCSSVKTDSYDYLIDGNIFTIIFVDRKFYKVKFDFSGSYTRTQWKVLAEIDRLITQIEESYAN